ncbi:MAG: DUF2723 domain-containing protein [Bacteroidales bacterium]|jgi:hypothetical protein|nr:DUF2723 domain-containing protein [Bacteroidales bacterium]MDD2204756.1 DUF2723 domain-containing protein [Bacteroidales bacterium]MDD3914179.1 DUF2723 domain-containing protein [Bacteroidales bacterium]MDD4633714.1 DUF2723 domain-containing protein [Bacteroidales bacterium]
MKNYKHLNNIIGWTVFAIATVTYFCTLEPTASWWDCGEYIATASKLQVGHPPGAPTFQLIGRFFSLFAFGNVEHIAMMVNVMSALCSSFTILFLFWSITMLAKNIIAPKTDLNLKENGSKKWMILVAGIIGALAYTFSDTFWFSAVEGEVYAMSSLCTAIVFWAILKWNEEKDDRYGLRWLIFISYVIGLSIGVHLLNLLAITAISLVVYYKKYKPRTKGVIVTILLSFVIIAAVLYIIIPLVVKLAGAFELFFVNTIGMPFNSGTIIYFILLIGLIVLCWYLTIKRNSVLWNTVIMSFVFLLIGYSTFFILVVRANTNTPINEGCPSDAISLLSYLNREQYGATPVVYGPYYNAPIDDFVDGSPTYVKDKESGKYLQTDTGKSSKPHYDKDMSTIFPRMWNNTKDTYSDAYKQWGKIKGTPMKIQQPDGSTELIYCPTFGENLRFFFSYQINHMYLRYFFWNFVGRQNDIESYGGLESGNWKSGIKFIDEARLGNQDLPDSMKNPANNSFYFLPLILGLLGLFYQFKCDSKNGLVVLSLFLMTGLAIIVYLNQTPFQPRERDYAYAGSFYAFAIWIGLGVLSIINLLTKLIKNEKIATVISFIICLLAVPTIMAKEGWDDHNRHGKYAACDGGKNYLIGCLPNSVLITNGDNDTFPLWYVQEVEGFRTDIRVTNFMLSSSDWYAAQMMRKVYNSDTLPLTLDKKDYYKGVNEYLRYHDRGIKSAVDITEFIKLLANDRFLMSTQDGKKINTFPCKTFKLKVDKEKVLANGIVPPEWADRIVDEIEWTITPNILYKNDLLFLDFIASFNWDRPLYFTNPSIVKAIFNVDKYCYLDGDVYRFVPVVVRDNYINGLGGVDADRSYDILVDKVRWGNLNDPKVTVDRESQRSSPMVKQQYYRLAYALLNAGKPDSAAIVADKMLYFYPNDKFPYDYYTYQLIDVYSAANQMDKVISLIETIHKRYYEEIVYYLSLKSPFYEYYQDDAKNAAAFIRELANKCDKYQLKELGEQYNAESESFVSILYGKQ